MSKASIGCGLVLAGVLSYPSPPSLAATLTAVPDFKETWGSQNYKGSSAYLELREGDFRLKPSFSSYSSDVSSGTYRTYSLKLAYSGEEYGASVVGGWTPEVNGYENHFVGGDASMTLVPAGGPLAAADLTLGLTRTIHTDQFQRNVARSGAVVLVRRTSAIDIAETDLAGDAALDFQAVSAILGLSKSVYDKDLAKLFTRAAPVANLQGLTATVQGFPDLSVTPRLELTIWPAVTPYVSYTYTKFKVAEPFSAAYTAGVYGKAGSVELETSYERYAQSGSKDVNYFSLGAKVRL